MARLGYAILPRMIQLAIGLCFEVVAAVSGLSAWEIQALGQGAVLQSCEVAPFETMRQIKGVGNIFVPVDAPRRTGR